MTPADLFLLGVWQCDTGYEVAAAFAFNERVNGWYSLDGERWSYADWHRAVERQLGTWWVATPEEVDALLATTHGGAG